MSSVFLIDLSQLSVSEASFGLSSSFRPMFRARHARHGACTFEQVLDTRDGRAVDIDVDDIERFVQRACHCIEVELPRFRRNVLPVLGVARAPRVGIVRESYHCAVANAPIDEWRLFERAAGFARGLAILRQRVTEPDEDSSWMPVPFNTHACVLAADGSAMVIESSTTDRGRQLVRDAIDESADRQAPLLYMSPNMIKRRRWSVQEDVWCLGVVLCEVASGGRPAFGALEAIDVACRVAYNYLLPDMPPEMPPSMRAIVLQCLVHDVDQRLPLASVVDLLTRGAARVRMMAICVALEWLDLPALVSLHIVEHAVLEAHTIPLHTQWAIVTRVKHLLSLEEKARRREPSIAEQ